jgi:two-component system OmpR family response regulator
MDGQLLTKQDSWAGHGPDDESCMRARRVLVVDDNPDITELLATLLRRGKWVPVIASNAFEAQAIAEAARPNVIVCDETMPGLTGSELIGRLKANPETQDIPMILMSGHDASVTRCAEADAFLAKPFTINQVLAAVEAVAARQALDNTDDCARETMACSAY